MFGKAARKRRNKRREERRDYRASKKDARRAARLDRQQSRQNTRIENVNTRADVKLGMVSAGIDPYGWVGDVTSGIVGVADAASKYGQSVQYGAAFDSLSDEERAKLGQGGGAGGDDDNTLLLVGAAAAAYFLLKK